MPVGDLVHQRLRVFGGDDAVALSTLEVQADVSLVLRGVCERARRAPIDATKLEPSGEIQCGALWERGSDLGPQPTWHGGAQPPDR